MTGAPPKHTILNHLAYVRLLALLKRGVQGEGATPWKFNIAPENIPSQKESSLPTIIFAGAMLNVGRVSGNFRFFRWWFQIFLFSPLLHNTIWT